MMQQLLAKTGFFPSNQALFKKAVDDIMQNKSTMINPVSAETRLIAYQKLFQQEKGKKLEELLFAKIKTTPGFSALPNGVRYAVSKMGTGIQPKLKDTVILNIITTLPDNTEVENTNKSKQSYMALVSEMVPGLRDILTLMKEGTICRAIVPAAQAYGEAGTASIPPYSAIIYDIALVSVKPAK
jgi:FKBP-type peptidyl-prolyl cis-trans isomerase